MKKWSRSFKVYAYFPVAVMAAILYTACRRGEPLSPDTSTLPFSKLSGYRIYRGDPVNLEPESDYKLYELSSQLFTDYAEKQRLIKLPPGTKMSAINNGLLHFPEGTIIVKTFYYFNDKRDTAAGKKLIETRILELRQGKWVAGTYIWNDDQTDALQVGMGLNKTVNWIDGAGNGKVISYHIPGNLECKTCHNAGQSVIPIGPKVRNLNFDVMRNNISVNQLTHLNSQGMLEVVHPANFTSMPNYNDVSKTIEQRGRAYLDINCAHCHTDNGFAERQRYRMDYETDLNSSKIKEGKTSIRLMMEDGDMPKIGTTIIDREGLTLIKQYLETL